MMYCTQNFSIKKIIISEPRVKTVKEVIFPSLKYNILTSHYTIIIYRKSINYTHIFIKD